MTRKSRMPNYNKVIGRVPHFGERILYTDKNGDILVGVVESSWHKAHPHFGVSLLYAPGKALIASGNTEEGFYKVV